MKTIHNNIQEVYCSFELSKLLKVKGCKLKTTKFYPDESWGQNDRLFDSLEVGEGHNVEDVGKKSWGDVTPSHPHCLAIEWIRVNFGIFITVETYSLIEGIFFSGAIFYHNNSGKIKYSISGFKSPQEATEAALLYVLKNLM